jgi:hypothetical protein
MRGVRELLTKPPETPAPPQAPPTLK